VPYLFPIFVIVMWLFMTAGFSLVRGCWSLAGRFRATERPAGEKIAGQVRQMGMVPEHLVTHIVASHVG
jgi:hypothetical protein